MNRIGHSQYTETRAFLEFLTVGSIEKFNYLELLDLSDKVEFENFEYIFRNDSLQNYKKY